MGMITAETVQALLFDEGDDERIDDRVGAVMLTPLGTITVVKVGYECDHYPCYEEHEVNFIVEIAGRHFQRKGTYSSQGGRQYAGPLREVKPVEKVVQDWEPVPAIEWTPENMSKHLREWMAAQDGSKYSDYDWVRLFYAAGGGSTDPVALEVPGFPWLIRGVESWTPGDPDYSGPVFLIFEINGQHYSIAGRNVSHCGWEFENYQNLVPTRKKTVTTEVWV